MAIAEFFDELFLRGEFFAKGAVLRLQLIETLFERTGVGSLENGGAGREEGSGFR